MVTLEFDHNYDSFYSDVYEYVFTNIYCDTFYNFSGIICVEGIAGSPVHIDYNCVPSVIYTHPVSKCCFLD